MEPAPVSSRFRVGDVIKTNYTLTRKIGAGSFGEIFEALFENGKISKTLVLKLELCHDEHIPLAIEARVLRQMDGLYLIWQAVS